MWDAAMLSCRPSGIGTALAPTGAALFFCALILALPARAGTTWDGGGVNASWGNLNNWNPNGLPLFNGTETITIGTAFTSGTTLTLDGTRYINDLVINTITGFTISAGTGGTLNLRSGNITRQDVAGTEAVQTISAGMVLGDPTGVAAYTGIWNIAGSNSLNVSGAISETGGVRGITKTGTGTVILSGANTYTGATTVSAGVLNIQNATGLGTIAAGTTVTSGAALQLQGVITVGAETLTLDGTGISSNGALRNISGNNSWAGTITINSTTRINSDSGTLTLDVASGNAITGSDDNLQIGGAGNVTINDAIATGTGTLTKDGAGTLTLSGTNTFSGGLTLNAGLVSISSDANLGASSGSLTFNGGSLYAADNVVGSRAIIMTGPGIFYTTFGKTLEESGAVSGNGNLTTANSGTLILSGSGSNGTGTTTVSGAVLSLRGTVSLGSGNLTLSGGLLELGNGNFTRALGTAAGQVNMNSGSGGAGFGAFGADRTVNLGGSGATVTWAVGNFVANAQPLYLGTPTADHMIDFQNPINLNLASRTITVTDGVGTGIDAKLSGVISGTGASNFVMNAVGFAPWNPGSLLLSNGNNSYAGTTTINAGTLLLGANATGTAGNTVLGSGATDVLVGNTTGTLNAGLLTNGAFTISRNIRAQSGNTGTISIGGYTADASTFSGSIILGTNSIATGKGVTLTAAAGGTVTFSGIIQDPTGVTTRGVLTKDGAGTAVLSGVNTYAGGTIINGGTLSISQVANLGATSGGLTINAGTLEISSGFSTSRVITLGDATSTFQVDPSQTYTVTSAIGGTGSLNKTGAGTMQLGGANTYAGSTVVSAGTLQLTASERIPNASALTISGGTFDVQTFSETVGNVTLSSGSITGTGAGTLTGSTYAVQSGTASAILTGTGSTMTKTTAGTVTLTGANTFTGATTISGGTLTASASSGSALGATSSVTVNSGGTLMLGASDQIKDTAPMTLAGGTFGKGNFSEGSASAPGVGALTLTVSGSQIDFGSGTVGVLTFASFTPGIFTLTIANWTGTPGTVGSGTTDRLIFNSDQNANLGSFSFTGYAPGAIEFNLGGGYYEIVPVTAVPEPSTYIAGALALATVGFHQARRLRRRSKRA